MQNEDQLKDESNSFTESQEPSKSQRKREAAALQEAGVKLVGLSPAQLDKIPLPAELLAEIRTAQGIRQRGARRRQLQYIGKLMRRIDTEPILDALAGLEAGSLAEKRLHHQVERLCETLLTDNETELTTFFDHYPAADRQHLRQLVRKAAQEQAQNKPPRSRRILFRYLREIIAAD